MMDKASQAQLSELLEAAIQIGRKLEREGAKGVPPQDFPKPDFKLNAKGDPEFASIILTLDHLVAKENGHLVIKQVLSTETAEQALRSNLEYFGEDGVVFKMDSTINQLVTYRSSPERGIFLYMPDHMDVTGGPIIQAIMSTAAFATLVAHSDYGNGSEYVCVSKLLIAFEQIMDQTKKIKGAYPPLTFLQLESMLKKDTLEGDHPGSSGCSTD